LKVITWNIRHGGGARIPAILNFLKSYIEYDVIVLTEVRNNKNLPEINKALSLWGYKVEFICDNPTTNSVLIASRLEYSIIPTSELGDHSHRILHLDFGAFRLMGCYFPQRQEKSIVFEYILRQIEGDKPLMVLGDFNTGKHLVDEDKASFYCAEYMGKLEESGLVDMFRALHPHAREFSWYSNSKNGFRIDHIFASEPFRDRLIDCRYIHGPREEKISDHSAMALKLS
jgi:exodeoxyribonuclease-3